MQTHDEWIDWSWQDRTVSIGLTRMGSGETLLMLPAMSSISTRGEMRPLQERLAGDYETVAVDWPGFGDAARPALAWHPDAYRAFLVWLIGKLKPPFATIAAGHAGGYCLGAAAQGVALGRLCLVAPTWRGPLPTVAGKRHKAFSAIARAGDLTVIGAALYRLNVNPFMVRRMALGHVYLDPGALPPALLAEKLAVTRAKGARHASIRFVTGELDPMLSREAFIGAAKRVSGPILLVYGADTPARSKAEMEALAALPNVRTALVPAGKLAVHEEFPDQVAERVRAFLRGG